MSLGRWWIALGGLAAALGTAGFLWWRGRAGTSDGANDAGAGEFDATDASGAEELGGLSEKYETAAKRPGAADVVSTGAGDPGGVSYGAWQFASQRVGTAATFVSWLAGKAPELAAEFDGLQAGTPDFTSAWHRVALRNLERFWGLQHDFVAEHHYEPAAERLRYGLGLEVNTRSRAVREVLWSTAVQHGVAGAEDVFRRALATGAETDEGLIRAVYGERARKDESGLVHFRSASPEVQAGVERRYRKELEDALRMLNQEGVA